ncbi:MAG: HD domain-containing protein [Defluviitaleaceae bacterium]|nr:HD domain-containing protein [Defluviitaleaceae bacterium]
MDSGRLEILRIEINKLIKKNQPDCYGFFVHLYGVSHFCSLLAMRRGLDPEIAAACGMLHDIYQVTAGEIEKHAAKGAGQAEKILADLNLFDELETETIVTAVSRHSKKKSVHGDYDELLKDADVMHHCLYDTSFPVNKKEKVRFNKTLQELGCISKE